jgi:hypothetical protein
VLDVSLMFSWLCYHLFNDNSLRPELTYQSKALMITNKRWKFICQPV